MERGEEAPALQTVALKPKRAEWAAMVIGLILLCAAMLALPVLCPLLALAVPLLACPLVRRREEAVAWVAAAVPTVSALMAGYDALFAASLLLIGALPLLITRLVPVTQRAGARGMLMYMSATAFSLTMVLAMATRMLGGPLPYTLAEAYVQWVDGTMDKQVILQLYAANGRISAPERVGAHSAIRPLMEAAYSRQLLLSLRLTAENLLVRQLPLLLVKASIIVGLFTSLRLERANGVVLVVETRTACDKRTRIIAPPGFRMLSLPRPLPVWLILLIATAAILLLTPGSFAQTLLILCKGTVETLLCLQGAAVMVFLNTRTDPDRKTLAGLLAAAVYLLAPVVLCLIGIADLMFHFRNPQAHKPD